jgi:hypothetical protein
VNINLPKCPTTTGDRSAPRIGDVDDDGLGSVAGEEELGGPVGAGGSLPCALRRAGRRRNAGVCVDDVFEFVAPAEADVPLRM